jgi:hypothetical protein
VSDIEMQQLEAALTRAKAAYRAYPTALTGAELEKAKRAIRQARYVVRLGQPVGGEMTVVSDPNESRMKKWVFDRIFGAMDRIDTIIDSPTAVDRFMVGAYVVIGVLWCRAIVDCVRS